MLVRALEFPPEVETDELLEAIMNIGILRVLSLWKSF